MNFQKRDITIIQANIVRQIYQPWLLSNSCKFHFHSESEPGRICLTCPNQPVANFHPDTIPNQLIQLIPAQIHQHSYYMILTLFTIQCTTIRLQPQLFFHSYSKSLQYLRLKTSMLNCCPFIEIIKTRCSALA